MFDLGAKKTDSKCSDSDFLTIEIRVLYAMILDNT